MTNIKKIIAIILIVACGYAGYSLTKKNSSQKVLGEQGAQEVQPTQAPQATPSYEKTVGDFLVTNNEICLEDGKPVVYFFGSEGCPHCVWEKPVLQKVVKNFEGLISYHENIDTQTDSDVFERYTDINPGYVPFLILGCKYARVGSGEAIGEEAEIENLTAIMCKLTGGKPSSVCNPLQEKTSTIK
jgi:thiol-disulfide isomerase/thioredoxin